MRIRPEQAILLAGEAVFFEVKARKMRYLAGALVVLLIVLHQDYWQWNDTRMVWGLLPWNLAWHIGLSIAAAVVWWLAVQYCWPSRVDRG